MFTCHSVRLLDPQRGFVRNALHVDHGRSMCSQLEASFLLFKATKLSGGK